MFCEQCGNKLNPTLAACPKCGADNPSFEQPITERSATPIDVTTGLPFGYEAGTEEAARPTTGGHKPAKGAENRLDSGVILANEEKTVRTYHCSGGHFPKCDGFLTVTNRRVIFHGRSDNSRIVDEVPLEAVSGLSTFYGGKWNVKRIIFGAIIMIASIALTISKATAPESPTWGSGFSLTSAMPPWLIVLGYLVALFLFATCHRKMFFLKVYSSKASGSPIAIGEGYGGFGGNGAVFAVSAFPTEQTDAMMLELGALINDLQLLGEHAIEGWRRK
ncbi:hypothetical protein FACS189425_02200 [Clostridia bacterium]|nr:hypothetical protein FACS189425_02200 [Clostridia bacterium]